MDPLTAICGFDSSRAAKFTLDAEADEGFAVWSPDGNRIVYASRKTGSLDIHLREKGSGSADVLLDSQENEVPTAWSRDGQFVLYKRLDPSTGVDIWKLPMSGTRTPSVFLQSRFQEHGGQFSPNGHWVAYQSNESGRYEIYVCTFPEAAVRLPVSANGGISPRWSRDGTQIFFVAPDATLMAVSVSEGKNGLSIGWPQALVRTTIVGGGAPPAGIDFEYDVAPDGRFLININSAPTASIMIVQNWKAGAQ